MVLNRRTLLLGVSAGIALALPATAGTSTADADALHKRVLVLDSHADVLLPSTPARYQAPGGGSRVSLEKLSAGGVDAIVLAIAVGPGPRDAEGVAAARRDADAKLEAIKRLVAENPAKLGLALSADDIERLKREGRIAILIGFQNARILGKDVSAIDTFYAEGARVFALNHAGHNDFSDSSRPSANEPESEHGGLSALGREAVVRLNDLGALIDVSQLSTPALLQTLALTRAPVAATHSNARTLVENTRNLSDRELDAIKANGGVVQVVPFAAYVHRPSPETVKRQREIRVRFGLPEVSSSANAGYNTLPTETQDAFLAALRQVTPQATLSEYVDQIDYIAKRIGVDHVGIGTDFDHGSGIVGFDSAAEAPNVTRELVRRGYTDAQIGAIWGGNFLRVLRAADAAAKR